METIFIEIEATGIIQKTAIRNFFARLAKIPGRYAISAEMAKKRSTQQNAYYWGAIIPLVFEGLQHLGFETVQTKDDTHEVLKALFLKKDIPGPGGEVFVTVTDSTTRLSTVEFMEYMEKIAQWAAEYLGIVIPPPGMQTAFFNE